MLRLLSFGALVALAILVLLPTGDGNATAGNIAVARADARLIERLREMAQVSENVETLRVALRAPTPDPGPARDPAPAAEIAKTPSQKLVVTTEALNLRAAPSSASEVLGRLLEGEAVDVARREGGWVRIAAADGTTGWAYGDYLTELAHD